MRILTVTMLLILAGSWRISAATDSWALIEGASRIALATPERGRALLGERDEFIRALSAFDRSARIKREGAITETEFLEFVAGQVREWTAADTSVLEPAIQRVQGHLAGWRLALPETVWLIKTTGKEEGDAAYTRGNAVILPVAKLSESARQLERLLLHELFHVLSRHQPQLRDRMYGIVGFRRVGAVKLPQIWEDRRITNPDAPIIEHAITVKRDDRHFTAMPFLYSREPEYRSVDRRSFFAFLEFRLLEIAEERDGWKPALRKGEPVLHAPDSVSGFFEQIGRNTSYIIHPEEVLADNFALLMLGESDLPSPAVVSSLKALLMELSAPSRD
ncbi:MAG TPA: hypothetical protein DCY13_12975 [Verrucomicrobiales bacterium]|nr:hypothetical protein [Verrucomicrobiales bacterium]